MARTIADSLNELYKNGVIAKIPTWINDYKNNIITALAPTFLKITDAANTYLTKAVASSTYLSKTDAANTYLGKTAKAASASYADSAGSATSATNANYATSAGTAATCTGNAATATRAGIVTGGTIKLTGGVTGEASFNTAGNMSIAATVTRNNIFYPTAYESTASFNDIKPLGPFVIHVTTDTPNRPPYTGQMYGMVLGRNQNIQQFVWNYAGGIIFMRGAEHANADPPDWTSWKKFTIEVVS